MIKIEEKEDEIIFYSEETIVLIVKYFYILHASFIYIAGTDRFERLSREEFSYCMEKMKKIVIEIEKNKGDLLRICHNSSKKLRKFFEKEMLWKENKLEKEKSAAYYVYKGFSMKGAYSFESWSINEEPLYRRDVNVLRTCKEVIELCKNTYILYGNWYGHVFEFYFYKKGYRKMYVSLSEEGKYQLFFEKEMICNDIETTKKEGLKEKIISVFEEIVKKERWIHLYEEAPSPLFKKYMREMQNYWIVQGMMEEMWGMFRKRYSYDELDCLIIDRLEKGEHALYTWWTEVIAGKFLTHYFAFGGKGKWSFMEEDLKNILEKIPKEQRTEWRVVFAWIKWKRTGSLWGYIKNVLKRK